MIPTPIQTLHTLAELNPDYSGFKARFPDELAATAVPISDGLAADILTVLSLERPELAKWINAQPSNPPKVKFMDTLAADALQLP
jgi:hypothetical protein